MYGGLDMYNRWSFQAGAGQSLASLDRVWPVLSSPPLTVNGLSLPFLAILHLA